MNKLNEITYKYGVTSKTFVKQVFDDVTDSYFKNLMNEFCDFIGFVGEDGRKMLRGIYYTLSITQDYYYNVFVSKCLSTKCTNVHITQMIGCVNFFIRRYNAIIDFIENGNPDMEYDDLLKFLKDRKADRFEGTLSHYPL